MFVASVMLLEENRPDGWIGVLVGAVVVGWIIVSRVSESSARKNRYYSDLSYYKRTFPVWQKLYYCHRCDIVYVPGEQRFVPATEMKRLLS